MQPALSDLDLTLLLIDSANTWSRLIVRRDRDSIHDLPLLERVNEPIVTNGDARLNAIARQRGWQTLQLFDRAAE